MKTVFCDVLVIGGGIVGCFTALRLAQKGLRVVIAERNTIFHNASGRSGGGVRQQARHPAETSIALESVKIWKSLQKEFCQDFEYRQGGSLRINSDIELHEEAGNRVERERSLGLDVRLIKADEVRRQISCLSQDYPVISGTYCPSDGSANPLLLGQVLSCQLMKHGVAIHIGECIEALSIARSKIEGAIGSKHQYRCSFVVNAGGAWANEVLSNLGLNYPVEYRKAQILITEPISPILKEFLLFSKGYIRQACAGNLHLGIRGEIIRERETSLPVSCFKSIGNLFPIVLPLLQNLHIIRGFSGITNWTPDGIPVIDKVKDIDGLWLVSGFSGHGFCLGPMIGKLIADWITEGNPEVELSAFSLPRFKQPVLAEY